MQYINVYGMKEWYIYYRHYWADIFNRNRLFHVACVASCMSEMPLVCIDLQILRSA